MKMKKRQGTTSQRLRGVRKRRKHLQWLHPSLRKHWCKAHLKRLASLKIHVLHAGGGSTTGRIQHLSRLPHAETRVPLSRACEGDGTQSLIDLPYKPLHQLLKISALPIQAPEGTREKPEWGSIRGGGARGRSTGGRWRGVDPIVPFTDAEQLASIRDFYGLAPSLKMEEQLISRSQSDDRKPKRLSFVSEGASLGSSLSPVHSCIDACCPKMQSH